MARDSLKIAVIGCGFVAENAHMPAWERSKWARVIALCDSNLKSAERVGQKYHVDRTYSDLELLLNDEHPDIVDICTSIDTHAPLAIQAMEAGCHVLTEKPMALTCDQADQMMAVAKRKQVKLSVIHNMLFLPTMTRMRSLVAQSALGELVRVEIKVGHPPWDFPAIADPDHWWQRLPGGVFGDSLPHALYLAREFLGSVELLTVHTYKLGTYKHLRVDEVQILLSGEKGAGSIVLSCNGPSLWQVDLYGSRGNMHGDLNNSFLIQYRGKTKSGQGIATLYARENLSRSLQILTSSFRTGLNMIRGQHKGHPVQIDRFIESIRHDTEPPVRPEDHREVLRLWEEITAKIDDSTPLQRSAVT